MTAIQLMLEDSNNNNHHQKISLRKALRYSGMSSCSYYYEPAPRAFEPDAAIVQRVEELALQRPFYGTRRMAAQLSRELRVPVNRKRVQKVFHKLNWIEPAKTKSEVVRSASKVVKASRPYEFWQTDMTYLWCGSRDRWSYLFNVIDVFHREWLGYAFETSAVKEHAIMSVNNALASHGAVVVPGELTLRCDNGPQYTSHAFKDSVDVLGLKLQYILYHTPEQNGFVESFHKTLKREYIWTRDFQSYQEAEAAIQDAFIDYNQNRIHSSLGYLTPYEYLDAWKKGKVTVEAKVNN
jgi:putative transposase